MTWKAPDIPDIPLPQGFTLVSAAMRPDLWPSDSDPDDVHPLDALWPEWIEHSASYETYSDALGLAPCLAAFQLFIMHTDANGAEDAVAYSNAVPFFHPALPPASADVDTAAGASTTASLEAALPDGGWDTILARGVLQAQARGAAHTQHLPAAALTPDQAADQPVARRADPPNLLAALGVTVLPAFRAHNLAAALIGAMARLAGAAGLHGLCVPLRPTRKSEFPRVPFEEYVQWRRDAAGGADGVGVVPPRETGAGKVEVGLDAFDPWLRRHMQLGAVPVKIAPSSMVIHGNVKQWFAWTGVDYSVVAEGVVREEPALADQDVVDVPLDAGLAPLRWDINGKVGTYTEQNIWMFHRV